MNNGFDVSIINIADDFYEAYLRCSEGKNPIRDEFGRIRYEAANVPAIVNGAFAIELYIKSISHADKKVLRQKKHKIKELLLTLDQSYQDEIRREVETKLDRYQTYDDCLNGIDNAFVFWRYIHTKRSFGFGLNDTLKVLPLFLDSLRSIAKRNNQ